MKVFVLVKEGVWIGLNELVMYFYFNEYFSESMWCNLMDSDEGSIADAPSAKKKKFKAPHSTQNFPNHLLLTRE